MDAGECLNYTGEKMLHAIFAWGIGKAGLEKILRKLGTWIRTTGLNIGRRRRRTTRNIASWKLNVKCVSVELGNLNGQDMWELESICWGAVVEKLMLMWGVGKDEMKGKHVLLTTVILVCPHLQIFDHVTSFMHKQTYPVSLLLLNTATEIHPKLWWWHSHELNLVLISLSQCEDREGRFQYNCPIDIIDLPSVKLTARTWQWMVGRWISFWEGLFSGAFAVSFRECNLVSPEATHDTSKACISYLDVLHFKPFQCLN